MITFKVNGKPLKVKSCWDDVSYKEYISILNAAGDQSKILSILTGIPYEKIRKAKIQGAEQLLIAVQFATKPIEIGHNLTQVGKYKLPLKGGKFDVRFESLGQFEDLRTIMTKDIKEPSDLLKAYPKAVAIYLQKIRDGEYDFQKADEMESEVLTLPCREVMTAGTFFLIKLLNLYSGTEKKSLKKVKASQPIGKRLRKGSGHTVRSTKRRGR